MRQILTLCLILVSVIGCSKTEVSESPEVKPKPSSSVDVNLDQKQISVTNRTEGLLLTLQNQLKRVGQHFLGVSSDVSDLFGEPFEYLGVDVEGLGNSDLKSPSTQVVGRMGLAMQSTAETIAPGDAVGRIWENVFSAVDKDGDFEDVSFGVLNGEVLEDGKAFRMETIFEGRFQDSDQRLLSVKAKQVLNWKLASGGRWKIAKWKQKSFDIQSVDRPLFDDVTSTAFDSSASEFFAKSEHAELILKRAKNRELPPNLGELFHYFVDWQSAYRYPSCSVVDLDRDGWDDLLVSDRGGLAKLFRNTGDGTFEDVTKTCGLKLDATSITCSLFVDFDNDGDTDCLLGQSIDPLTFYRNVNGKFVADEKVNRKIGQRLFVTSAAVVDINRDGLLDVYLSTYCSGPSRDHGWMKHAVPRADFKELAQRAAKSHWYLDRSGPPNYVLMNRDGNLEEVPVDDRLKQWRCSYQSVWADVDNDGDSDLYVCNDFAPDSLLLNETPRGAFEPVFEQVPQEIFEGGEIGFGMGASFGDYDSDGDLDLYVSNMYSKAGRRILQRFDDNVDQRMFLLSQGNFLFRNDGKKFKQVAGLDADTQHVSKVGWSFGGQFADFNNDQKLDLYVPSGFFTPPADVDVTTDL